MTTAKKALIWFSGILGVLLLAALVVFMAVVLPIIRSMKPTETDKIVDNIYAVKDSYVNLYVVRTGDSCIVFDAGTDSENVEKELRKIDINPARVAAVLLTHSDSDHTGALSLFTNARLFLSKDEEQMINGQTRRFPLEHNCISHKQYTLLADGENLTFGSTQVQAIATPGHTRGAMSYIVNGQAIITGDALNLKNDKITPFFCLINMDNKQAAASIQKICRIHGPKYLLTAHTGISSKFENVASEYEPDN